MAEDNTNQSGDGGTVVQTPTADEVKAARKAAIDKLSLDAQRKAVEQQGGRQDTPATTEDEIDLDDLDPKVAKAVRKVLENAKAKDVHVRTLAQYGIEQARKVKALEIGTEFGLEKDEISEIEKALTGANSPDALDIAGREVVIALKTDGSFGKVTTPDKASTTKVDGDKLPPVDTGRGNGVNRVTALQEKIDAIDPYDPNAASELAKLEKDMKQAQADYERRFARRNS